PRSVIYLKHLVFAVLTVSGSVIATNTGIFDVNWAYNGTSITLHTQIP
ncbi:hypothetical protein SAMN05216225_104736, partial [Ornithinibacillus halophilus]